MRPFPNTSNAPWDIPIHRLNVSTDYFFQSVVATQDIGAQTVDSHKVPLREDVLMLVVSKYSSFTSDCRKSPNISGYVFLHPLVFCGLLFTANQFLNSAHAQETTSKNLFEMVGDKYQQFQKNQEATIKQLIEEEKLRQKGKVKISMGSTVLWVDSYDPLYTGKPLTEEEEELRRQGKVKIPMGSTYIWVDPDDPYLVDPVFGGKEPSDSTTTAVEKAQVSFDDNVVRCANQALLQLIEGNLGAMVATAAGIGALIAIAFGAPRAAISFLMVCLASFTLRAFVVIHFGEAVIQGKNCNAALGLTGAKASENSDSTTIKPGEPIDPYSDDPMDWGLGS